MKRYILTIFFVVWVSWANAAPCPETITTPVSCDSITQYGITWTLSSNETVGQFINGDYYIIDDGSVTVSNVSPPTTGEGLTLVNGSMINPDIYTYYENLQGRHGLDGDALRYNAAQTVVFPLSLSAGDTLISSISLTNETLRWDGLSGVSDHDDLASVAYLTIMSNTLADYSAYLRPAPTDRNQTLYNASSLDLSWLPNLSTSGMTLPSFATFATPMDWAIRGTARPWPLFVYANNGRNIHAIGNMHNYHREIGYFLGRAFLLLVSDLSGKAPLALNMTQIGIDMYHAGILGIPDSSIYITPIMFAGKTLNNPSLLNCVSLGTINGTNKGIPRDFPDFYYLSDVTPAVTSSIIPAGQVWRGNYQAAYRNNVGVEYDHLHPSEWSLVPGFSWSHETSYRVAIDSHQHVGMVLFAHITNLKAQWGNPATFDYMDYWMDMDTADHMAECAIKAAVRPDLQNCTSTSTYTHTLKSGSTFIDQMWAAYRNTPPPGLQRRSFGTAIIR